MERRRTELDGQHRRLSRPLRIGVVCLSGLGGSGNVARACARACAKHGFDTHIITGDGGFWRDVAGPSLTPHTIAMPTTPQTPCLSWIDPLASELAALVRRNKLDILNVHYAAGIADAAVKAKEILAAENHTLKIAVTLHGTDVSIWGKDPSYGPQLARVLAQCDEVTAVAENFATQAQEIFQLAERPLVIVNSIDRERFRPGNFDNHLRQSLTSKGELLLCHVSNLRPVKRPLDALDALARVRAAGVDAKLLIVGPTRDDNPLLAEMYQRIRELDLGDNVLFSGGKDPDQVMKHVAVSDVILVTSESESFCLAALEAMASGVPVVGTRCGGLEEIMATVDYDVTTRTCRLLADVGDTDSLANIVVGLIRDPRRYERVQEQGLALPFTEYTEERQARGYLDLMDSLRPVHRTQAAPTNWVAVRASTGKAR